MTIVVIFSDEQASQRIENVFSFEMMSSSLMIYFDNEASIILTNVYHISVSR